MSASEQTDTNAAAFVVTKFQKDQRAIVTLTGSFTLPHLDDVFPHCVNLFDVNESIAMDLSGITEIDSAGLQFLAVLKKNANVLGKKLKYINHSPGVIDLIELYGVAGLFRDKIVLPPGSGKRARFRYGIAPQEFA